jgi:hypothetical protein
LILAFASSGFAVRVRPFVVFLVIHLYIYNALLSVSLSLTRLRRKETQPYETPSMCARILSRFLNFSSKKHSRFREQKC